MSGVERGVGSGPVRAPGRLAERGDSGTAGAGAGAQRRVRPRPGAGEGGSAEPAGGGGRAGRGEAGSSAVAAAGRRQALAARALCAGCPPGTPVLVQGWRGVGGRGSCGRDTCSGAGEGGT